MSFVFLSAFSKRIRAAISRQWETTSSYNFFTYAAHSDQQDHYINSMHKCFFPHVYPLLPMKGRKRTRTSYVSSSESATTSPTLCEPPLKLKNDKKAKFDLHYKTATKLAEGVIGMSFLLLLHQFSPGTPEQQKKTWSSAVYDHFRPPEIQIVGNVIKYVFVCKK